MGEVAGDWRSLLCLTLSSPAVGTASFGGAVLPRLLRPLRPPGHPSSAPRWAVSPGRFGADALVGRTPRAGSEPGISSAGNIAGEVGCQVILIPGFLCFPPAPETNLRFPSPPTPHPSPNMQTKRFQALDAPWYDRLAIVTKGAHFLGEENHGPLCNPTWLGSPHCPAPPATTSILMCPFTGKH